MYMYIHIYIYIYIYIKCKVPLLTKNVAENHSFECQIDLTGK